MMASAGNITQHDSKSHNRWLPVCNVLYAILLGAVVLADLKTYLTQENAPAAVFFGLAAALFAGNAWLFSSRKAGQLHRRLFLMADAGVAVLAVPGLDLLNPFVGNFSGAVLAGPVLVLGEIIMLCNIFMLLKKPAI